MSDFPRKRGFEEDSEYEPSGSRIPSRPRSLADQRNTAPQREFKRIRRPRMSQEIEVLKGVCHGISQLGDKPDNIMEELKNTSETIAKEWDSEEFRQHFLDYTYALIVEQPQKMQLFGALVQIAAAHNPAVGAEIGAFVEQKAQNLLDNADELEESEKVDRVTHLKLIARFLATVAPAFQSVDPVVDFFDQVLKLAIALNEASGDGVRNSLAELLFFAFTLSIPYILAADRNNEALRKKCDTLVSTASGFDVKELEDSKTVLSQFLARKKDEEAPYDPQNLAQLVLKAVERLDVKIFRDVQAEIQPILEEIAADADAADADTKMETGEEEKEGDNEKEREQQQQEESESKTKEVPKFLGIKVPTAEQFKEVGISGHTDNLWKCSRFPLEIFSKNLTGLSFEIVPSLESYEGLILRDVVQDVVQGMEFNRITVSRQLLALPHYFNDKLFAKSNSSEDKLTIVDDLRSGVDLLSDLENNPDIPAEMKETMLQSAERIQQEYRDGYTGTWRMENVILEGVLDLMLHLPEPTVRGVYYQTLLADTCGRDWTLMRRTLHSNEKIPFSKTLAEAIKFFYKNATTLDFAVRAQCVSWMLIQLSNFNFEWQWDDWKDDAAETKAEPFHPKRFILKNAIAKEVRVSTPQQIRSTLPEELRTFTNLALLSSEEAVEYDSKFFGQELAQKVADSNAEVLKSEMEADANEPSRAELGNAEVYHVVEQYLFNNDQHEFHTLCHSIYTNLQEGESLQSFNDLVGELKKEASEKVAEIDEYIVALVAQSVCIIGSRSLSVIEGGALELCGDKVRKTLGLPLKEEGEEEELENDQFDKVENTSERQVWLMDAVLRLWNNEPRIGFLILEKFRNKGLVKSTQLISRVFQGPGELLAVTEIYADELLDRLLLEEVEGETETSEERQHAYVDAAVKTLDGAEGKWVLQGIVGSIVSKLRKICSAELVGYAQDRIEAAVTNAESKQEILRVVASLGEVVRTAEK